MKRLVRSNVIVLLALLMLSSCGSKEDPAAQESAPAAVADTSPPQASAPAAHQTTDAISAARSSLKAGNVDEAAAKLAELQLRRASFTSQQAKDYRQALSEAYDRAIEAAQRGDPKAQAALQLLRAAGPR